MDHEFYIDRLSAYFDGELKHEEEYMVEEHIKDCSECRKILEDLKKFDHMVATHSELGENDYWEKSAQKIEKAISGEITTEVTEVKPKARSIWLSWKAIGSLATAAVLIFIAVNYVDIQKSVETQMTPTAKSADSTTVDQLLDNVTGVVVANTGDSGQGEVFIRGGRAGETSYIVDGVPEETLKKDADKADNEIVGSEKTNSTSSAEPSSTDNFAVKEKTKELTVQKGESVKKEQLVGEADKTNITESLNVKPSLVQSLSAPPPALSEGIEASITLEDNFEVLELNEAELSLEQWRTKTDSLNALIKNESKKRTDKTAFYEKSTGSRNLDTTEVLRDGQLVDCYFNIGRLTEDKEEYIKAVMMLKVFKESKSETLADKATRHLDKLLEMKRFSGL